MFSFGVLWFYYKLNIYKENRKGQSKKNVKKYICFGQINSWCLSFLFKFANYTGWNCSSIKVCRTICPFRSFEFRK